MAPPAARFLGQGRLRRGRFGRRSALPLARDGAGRFLPVLVGVMVLLLAAALEGALGTMQSVERWERALRDRATVQIPDPGLPRAPPEPATREAAVLAVLAAEPGIVAVTPLSDGDEARLLAPWLGADFAMTDLPVPRLVDLRLARPEPAASGPDPARPDAGRPDLVRLGVRLAAAAPGTTLDDHAAWIAGIARLADKAVLAAAAFAGAAGLVTILTVVFTSRTGLLIHSGIVGLLHLIGARDQDVARHFQWYAFRLSFVGGAGGAAVAALGLLALANGSGIADRTSDVLGGVLAGVPGGMRDLAASLPVPRIDVLAWSLIAALPPATALVAALTARVTVLRMLARMDGDSSFYAEGAIR